jgi:plasmid stability protein
MEPFGATDARHLSIKNAPDDVVRRLRERAARNHRSLQRELMAIIEEAVKPSRYMTVAGRSCGDRARGS